MMNINDILHTLIRKPSPREMKFAIGQRVKMSEIGLTSLRITGNITTTGVVVKSSGMYPDAVAIVRDGSASRGEYHNSYWEIP